MPQRMGSALMGFLSVLALVLATGGNLRGASYVPRCGRARLAYGCARRRTPRDRAADCVGRVCAPSVIGIVAGVGMSLWAGRLASAFLYDVSASDPLTFGAVVALLGASPSRPRTCRPPRRTVQPNRGVTTTNNSRLAINRRNKRPGF